MQLKRKHILLMILFFAFVARSYEINEPWVGHHDWNGAIASNIARNIIRYGGFLETDFGVIHDYDYVEDGNFSYYITHPPLFFLLHAVWVMAFGLNVWASRLFVMLFSVLGILGIYLVTKKIWGERIGIYAAFFAAFMPASIYFGRMVDYEPLILFFVVSEIYFYWNWLESKRSKDLLLMMIFAFLAQATDWPGYFLSAVPVVHNILFAGEKRNIRMMSIIVLLGCVNILFFFSYLLSFPGAYDAFLIKFGQRTAITFLMADYWRKAIIRLVVMFNPIIFALVCYGSWIFLRLKKKLDPKSGLLLTYLALAWVSPILQSEAAYIHDYIFGYYLIPFFAIVGAIVFERIKSKTLSMWITAFYVVLSFGITIFYFNINTDWDRFYLGMEINEHTDSGDSVIVSCYITPNLRYYAQRDIVRGNDIQTVEDLVSDGRYRYWIYSVGNESVLEHMRERYQSEEYGPYLFFDLQGPIEGGGTANQTNDVLVQDNHDDASVVKKYLKDRFRVIYDLFKFW